MEQIFLDRKEYAKIVSEINDNYHSLYREKKLCAHFSVGIDNAYYIYYFENHGFDKYRFVGKVEF